MSHQTSAAPIGRQVIEVINWFVPVLALRFVLCGVDTCVWPSNSIYVGNCLATFINVLAMSPNNAGHCQTPVSQSQTTTDAWVKHRRVLEDTLKKGRMDITVPVTLTFDKSTCHANDKRNVNHPCLFVTAVDHQQQNSWTTSSAVSKGIIGPCSLIRVTDMKGFDPDNRFGPAMRTEQFLGSSQYIFGFSEPFYKADCHHRFRVYLMSCPAFSVQERNSMPRRNLELLPQRHRMARW